MDTPRRGPAERLQAWLVTGPLGHLWSVLADLAVFVVRQLADKLRRASAQRRLAGAGRRPSERR